MIEHDQFPDLRELARVGEQYAHPLPAEQVRRLGQRRRTRRQVGFVSAVILAGVVAGGVVTSTTGLRHDPPAPVATPTVPTTSSSPTRMLTQDNLIVPGEIPSLTKEKVLVTNRGVGRSVQSASICVPENGFDSLGAVQVLSRNFRYDFRGPGFKPDPGHPMYKVPQFYTIALQFADEAAAKRGLGSYRGWLTGCAAELERRHHILIGSETKTTWVDVPSGTSTIGEFAVLPTYELPGAVKVNGYFEGAYWEHVGLTRVADRVMITVEVVWSNEYHDSLRPGGDPQTGTPPNVQFALVRAAANRLAR